METTRPNATRPWPPRDEDGPDHVESGSLHQFEARVALEGEALSRIRSEEVQWRVMGTDAQGALPVPASVSVDGLLTSDRVEIDTEIILQAAYVNDDDTVCLAERPVTISAGDSSDGPTGSPVVGQVNPCGAIGMIGLLGLFVGTWGLRLARK